MKHLLSFETPEILGPKGTPGCGIAQGDRRWVKLFFSMNTNITTKGSHTRRFVMLTQ